MFASSALRSFKWSLSFRFLRLKFCIYISHLFNACYIPRSFIFHDLKILIIVGEQHSWTSWRGLLHPPSLDLSQVQMFPSALCSQTNSIRVLPLIWVTKLRTHTKPESQTLEPQNCVTRTKLIEQASRLVTQEVHEASANTHTSLSELQISVSKSRCPPPERAQQVYSGANGLIIAHTDW